MQLLTCASPHHGDVAPQALQYNSVPTAHNHETHHTARQYRTKGTRVKRHRCPMRHCCHYSDPLRDEEEEEQRRNNAKNSSISNVDFYNIEVVSHNHSEPQDDAIRNLQGQCNQTAYYYYPSSSPSSPQNSLQDLSTLSSPYSYSPHQQTLISRGVGEQAQQVPQQQQQQQQYHLISQEYRERVITYLMNQLPLGNADRASVKNAHKLEQIKNLIIRLEDQICRTCHSQEDYITKLAARLAAILQQLDSKPNNRASTLAASSSSPARSPPSYVSSSTLPPPPCPS